MRYPNDDGWRAVHVTHATCWLSPATRLFSEFMVFGVILLLRKLSGKWLRVDEGGRERHEVLYMMRTASATKIHIQGFLFRHVSEHQLLLLLPRNVQ